MDGNLTKYFRVLLHAENERQIMQKFERLNGLQKMMLRWESFHALNAAHVVELGRRRSPTEVQRAVEQTCAVLGLGPIEFCPPG